jgi:hypothetical protein
MSGEESMRIWDVENLEENLDLDDFKTRTLLRPAADSAWICETLEAGNKVMTLLFTTTRVNCV